MQESVGILGCGFHGCSRTDAYPRRSKNFLLALKKTAMMARMQEPSASRMPKICSTSLQHY